MARLGRKPVKPGRATTAVTLGTVGLFVLSLAAGTQNWPFGAAGAAMLAIGVALLTTASIRGSDKAFVAGTLHVVKVSDPPLTTDFGRCEMHVLLDAPGHPSQTVMIRDPRVPVDKWPEIGETLPALVSVSDARRIKIRWDQVRSTYGERYDFDSVYDESGYALSDGTSNTDPIGNGYTNPLTYSDRLGKNAHDVFISYKHGDDSVYVERLAAHLRAAGVECWYDREIVTGQRWTDVIEQKISTCAAFIVVMTPAAKASDWVDREIQQAQHTGRVILPLLLFGDRFFSLANVHFEDVRGGVMPSTAFVTRLSTLTRAGTTRR